MATVSVSDFNKLIEKVCTVYGRPITGNNNNLDYSGCNNDFYNVLIDTTKSKMFFLNTNTAATVSCLSAQRYFPNRVHSLHLVGEKTPIVWVI